MAAKKPVILVLILSLIGAGWWVYDRYYSRPAAVIEASGTIEATTVDLCAKTAGTIKKLPVQEGDTVNAGQVVASLERNDLKAQKERDEMALLKAEAQLADLASGARIQEKKEAEANAAIARTNYNKAQSDQAVKEELFRAGAASSDELDKYRTATALAENQLKAAEARLSLVEAGSRPAAITAAKAEVERSKAVLNATLAQLADLDITSPINGEIVTKNYEAGEYVSMGAAVATVADLGDLWIKVYVPTDDLPYVKLGQRVSFTVSGLEKTFSGQVTEIAAKGEYTPKTIQTKKERANVVFGVKIKTGSDHGTLKPGMPADVEIKRGE